MKWTICAGFAAALFGLAPSSNAAVGWSQLFTIQRLETSSSDFFVEPLELANNATNDPNNCQTTGSFVTGYRIATSGLTAEARELAAKTLLAAFMGGRKVELHISSTCSGTIPVFTLVGLHHAN
jgi:hypothetical protein